MSENQNHFSVPLSPGAIATLHALFIEGPLFDGDVPSKQGRDELVDFGLAVRHSGYQQLSKRGLVMCIEAKMDRPKEQNVRRRRKALAIFEVVENILCPPDSQASAPMKGVTSNIAELLKRDEEKNARSDI